MTFGLRCCQPAGPEGTPPAPGLTAGSCSSGRPAQRAPRPESLLSASFSFRLLAAPCGFATVAVIGSGWILSSNEIPPMLGTLARPYSCSERKFIDIGGNGYALNSCSPYRLWSWSPARVAMRPLPRGQWAAVHAQRGRKRGGLSPGTLPPRVPLKVPYCAMPPPFVPLKWARDSAAPQDVGAT